MDGRKRKTRKKALQTLETNENRNIEKEAKHHSSEFFYCLILGFFLLLILPVFLLILTNKS